MYAIYKYCIRSKNIFEHFNQTGVKPCLNLLILLQSDRYLGDTSPPRVANNRKRKAVKVEEGRKMKGLLE